MGCGGSKDVDKNATRTRQARASQSYQPDDVIPEKNIQDKERSIKEDSAETVTSNDQTDDVIEDKGSDVEDDVTENVPLNEPKVDAIQDNDNDIEDDVTEIVPVNKSKGTVSNGRTSKGSRGQTGSQQTERPPSQPVNEKGYKRRIRENLRQATSGNDLDELDQCIAVFEKNKMVDNGDLYDAKERRYFLSLRKDLRDAILRRHPGVVDKAIQDAEASPYCADLQNYLDRARELREHLVELDRYRHDILTMDQATISEIRSYHHPPVGVHETMLSTYLILGYEERKLVDWADIQCLLGRYGKESLVREVRNADTVNLNEATTKRVDKLQSQFTLEKIRDISCGAAAFYEWNNKMCQKFSKDNKSTPKKKQSVPEEEPPASSNAKGRKKNKG